MYKLSTLVLIASISWVFSFGAYAAGESSNTFNRMMKPKAPANLPPAEDGIHDPESPGTHQLQPPKEAFDGLVKAKFGNHVDWIKSINAKKITPRHNSADASAKPIIMNLNIVRQVKGSMPDVVFPHDRHTLLLACSNCHTGIFIPQKGANQMSMAAIMLGESCGKCHGSVAFPVATSTCKLCHSKPKAKNAELKRSTAGK